MDLTHSDYLALTVIFWLGFWIYWFWNVRGNKENAVKQSLAMRIPAIVMILVCFYALFAPLTISILSELFISSPAVYALGALMSLGGLLFSVWGRSFLGRNWSAVAAVKKNHELIRNGPYAIVRHPMYAGFILAMLGTALVVAKLLSFLAVAFAFYALNKKIEVEEMMLSREFPEEYQDYKRKARKLIPFLY